MLPVAFISTCRAKILAEFMFWAVIQSQFLKARVADKNSDLKGEIGTEIDDYAPGRRLSDGAARFRSGGSFCFRHSSQEVSHLAFRHGPVTSR